MSLDKILKSKIWPAGLEFLSYATFLLGLPLLVWGLDSLASFFSNPVRRSYAVVVIAQALLHAGLVYITPPQSKSEPRYDLANWHSYLFEIIFLLAAYGDRRGILVLDENLLLRWTGLAIYLVAAVFSLYTHFTWASHRRTKGEFAVDNPVLLFEGPYKWIRYPSLLSQLFFCLGFTLALRSLAGLIMIVPLAAGIIQRIKHLENIYAQQYKKVWPLRRHTSKRLIPFLY